MDTANEELFRSIDITKHLIYGKDSQDFRKTFVIESTRNLFREKFSAMVLPCFNKGENKFSIYASYEIANQIIEQAITMADKETASDLEKAKRLYETEQHKNEIAELVRLTCAQCAKRNIDEQLINKLRLRGQENKDDALLQNITIEEINAALLLRIKSQDGGKLYPTIEQRILQTLKQTALYDGNTLNIIVDIALKRPIVNILSNKELRFTEMIPMTDTDTTIADYNPAKNELRISVELLNASNSLPDQLFLIMHLIHELKHYRVSSNRQNNNYSPDFPKKFIDETNVLVQQIEGIYKDAEGSKLGIKRSDNSISIILGALSIYLRREARNTRGDMADDLLIIDETLAYLFPVLFLLNVVIEHCEKYGMTTRDFGLILTLEEVKDLHKRIDDHLIRSRRYDQLNNQITPVIKRNEDGQLAYFLELPTKALEHLLATYDTYGTNPRVVLEYCQKQLNNEFTIVMQSRNKQRAMYAIPQIYAQAADNIGKRIRDNLIQQGIDPNSAQQTYELFQADMLQYAAKLQVDLERSKSPRGRGPGDPEERNMSIIESVDGVNNICYKFEGSQWELNQLVNNIKAKLQGIQVGSGEGIKTTVEIKPANLVINATITCSISKHDLDNNEVLVDDVYNIMLEIIQASKGRKR